MSLLALSACGKNESTTTDKANIFDGIFEDKISFFDVDNQVNTTISEYMKRIGSEKVDVYILCDLDGDNVCELICGVSAVNLAIFHYGEDDKVYAYLIPSGYLFWETGEIYSASGASTGVIFRIKEFNDKSYTTTVIAKAKRDGREDILYYLNDEQVSGEKYWEYHNSLGEYLSWNRLKDEKIIETENISYTYPQFKNAPLANKIIEDYANGRCTDNSIDLSDGTHLEGKYTIKYKDNNLISIVFEEKYYNEKWAHSNTVCKGIVIDVNNNKLKKLIDYRFDKSKIIDFIDNGKYEIIYGGLKEFTKEDIKKHIQDNIENGSIDLTGDCFWVEDNSIYLICNTLQHALGDYAIIKFLN